MAKIPRSVAHRLARRRKPYRYWMEPIISPYLDRLREAAFDGEVCRLYVVNLSTGDVTGGPQEPGIVQHCNERTGYEMIVHAYDPDGCAHCADIAQVMDR